MDAVAFLLLALGVAAVSAGSDMSLSGGGGSVFPPYSLCDRELSHSPYRISIIPSSQASQLCFRVDAAPCDSRWRCCSMGLHQFELEANIKLTTNVQAVYVDSIKRAFEFHARLGVLRVTNIGRTLDSASTTTICIHTRGLSTPTNLCRPTPSGSPACKVAIFNKALKRECCPVSLLPTTLPTTEASTLLTNPKTAAITKLIKSLSKSHKILPTATSITPTFPFQSKCNRAPGPFTLSQPKYTVNVEDGTTEFCFQVQKPSGVPVTGGTCATMDVSKVEFEVSSKCHLSLAYTSVNGVKRPPFFQTKPYSTIKVTNLNLSHAKAAGTTICLALLNDASCNSLQDLCTGGACKAAFFSTPVDNQYSCCPVTHTTTTAAS